MPKWRTVELVDKEIDSWTWKTERMEPEDFFPLEREKHLQKPPSFRGFHLSFAWPCIPPASGVGMALRTWVFRHRSINFREWFILTETTRFFQVSNEKGLTRGSLSKENFLISSDSTGVNIFYLLDLSYNFFGHQTMSQLMVKWWFGAPVVWNLRIPENERDWDS